MCWSSLCTHANYLLLHIWSQTAALQPLQACLSLPANTQVCCGSKYIYFFGFVITKAPALLLLLLLCTTDMISLYSCSAVQQGPLELISQTICHQHASGTPELTPAVNWRHNKQVHCGPVEPCRTTSRPSCMMSRQHSLGFFCLNATLKPLRCLSLVSCLLLH